MLYLKDVRCTCKLTSTIRGLIHRDRGSTKDPSADLLIIINSSTKIPKVIKITIRSLNHLATITDTTAEGASSSSPLHHRNRAKVIIVELVVVDRQKVHKYFFCGRSAQICSSASWVEQNCLESKCSTGTKHGILGFIFLMGVELREPFNFFFKINYCSLKFHKTWKQF
jgi:hypothetical protein